MAWYKEFDWLLVFCWIFLFTAGLIAIYSATLGPVSQFLPDYIQNNFLNQIIWIGVSILILVMIQFADPRTFQQISYILYIVCILLAIATVIWGTEAGGARRWLVIGSMRFQISEMLKLATILAVSNYLTSRRDISAEHIGSAFVAVVMMLIPSVIIIFQNDTGTALVLLAIIPVMLFWSGLPHGISLFLISPAIIAYFSVINWMLGVVATLILSTAIFFIQKRLWLTTSAIVTGSLVVAGVQVALYQILRPHQQARIEAFINPALDPQGAGWNVMQAKTAIGSGGLWGKGFLEGTQTQLRFLPEQWTDFIFPVIAEEFGFVGAGLVLLIFSVLLLRLLNIAGEHKHPFAQLVVVGITATFFVHLVINLGSAMGLFPVIGLPLPFISYGGSAFLSYSVMLAISLNFYMNRRQFSILS
ncbi:rod shape-determining protein RodA [Natronogracilivirga saccharolytica]|uniref:Cell wall polymerase n=1 Tax=Natronogracilivirga saccharolytica TaxID=2812953 RepID=A0A8J7S325_9BACT|nr:rod shape-determining protein RodA [Natronogracilivirga saccharolytica]MBP3191158.1 rod shape-determining protein RodA [Natronogracilivirga saccharolytica]